jgi:putative membrane protein
MMNGLGMGFGGFGFLLMAIFWIVIVAAAIWLVGNLFPQSNRIQPTANAPESAVDIVKRRYARGEISKDEYEAMRHSLEQSVIRPEVPTQKDAELGPS